MSSSRVVVIPRLSRFSVDSRLNPFTRKVYEAGRLYDKRYDSLDGNQWLVTLIRINSVIVRLCLYERIANSCCPSACPLGLFTLNGFI